MAAPVVNHNVDLSIEQMVRNRLPFLPAGQPTTSLISAFTLEVMWELEVCFQVGLVDDVYDPNRVGHEENYAVVQQSIIADIVATYILLIQGAQGITSTTEVVTPTIATFLKRAKAGSSEVEFGQLDSATFAFSTSGIGVEKLLDKYKSSAIRRAAALGCFFDICGDCTIAFMEMHTMTPFAISAPRSCGGCGA